MFLWMIKDSENNVYFKTESYCEAYDYLFSISEDVRKAKEIFLDFEVVEWS